MQPAGFSLNYWLLFYSCAPLSIWQGILNTYIIMNKLTSIKGLLIGLLLGFLIIEIVRGLLTTRKPANIGPSTEELFRCDSSENLNIPIDSTRIYKLTTLDSSNECRDCAEGWTQGGQSLDTEIYIPKQFIKPIKIYAPQNYRPVHGNAKGRN